MNIQNLSNSNTMQININDNNSFASSIQPAESHIDEEALEKFYEEKQSFLIDSIAKASKDKDKAKPLSQQSKHSTPRSKTNFDDLSRHKNILPSNIISYETFKEGNKGQQQKQQQRKQSTNTNAYSESQSTRVIQKNNSDDGIHNRRYTHDNSNKDGDYIFDLECNTTAKQDKVIINNIPNANANAAVNSNEQTKYEYNTFRKNTNQQQKEKEKENKINSTVNINSHNNNNAITLTDHNNKYHQANIMNTESKPYTSNTYKNLFNRSINLKSELSQTGLISNQHSLHKPKQIPLRPMTPIISTKSKLNPNTSITSSINPNPNLNNDCTNTNQAINQSYISNPTYASEMVNIVSKRKAILEASPSTNTNTKAQSKTKAELFNDFYNRNIDYHNKIKEQTDTKRNQKTKEELDQCSFSPKISQSTQKIINASSSGAGAGLDAKTANDFYKKNINWKNNRDKEIQHQSIIHDKEKYEECYFHPTINRELHEKTLKEMKGQKPDYIYKKNIRWLAQVNENRKKEQLEQIEQLNFEKEKVKEQKQKLLEIGTQLRNNQSATEILNQLARPKYPIEKHYQYRSQSVNKKKCASNRKGSECIERSKDRGDGYMIGKDIDEIKDLISSLKETLDENRKMNSVNYNRDMIVIDQSCNVNIGK